MTELQEYLKLFKEKHSTSSLVGSIEALDKLKVLIIGDIIIDEYHYCVVLGTSPKDNIINVKGKDIEAFAGGVLAVSNHMANFCKNVDLLTVIGEGYEGFIEGHLSKRISRKFFSVDGRPTTVKRRFVEPDSLNKLFGISFFDDLPLPENTQKDIHQFLESNIKNYDLVLVSDFGHGLLSKDTKYIVCGDSRFLAVNTQTNSANLGFNFITDYLADYICIDELELRLALQSKYDKIEELMVALSRQLHANDITITRGKSGSLTLHMGEFISTPSFAKEIIDRTGAGDAYLSITSLCAAGGLPMDAVSFIGNAAAALKLRTVCNREPIEPIALYKFISTLLE